MSNLDTDAMMRQLMNQLPALVRPMVTQFLASHGIVLGQEVKLEPAHIPPDTGALRFEHYVLFLEQPILLTRAEHGPWHIRNVGLNDVMSAADAAEQDIYAGKLS